MAKHKLKRRQQGRARSLDPGWVEWDKFCKFVFQDKASFNTFVERSFVRKGNHWAFDVDKFLTDYYVAVPNAPRLSPYNIGRIVTVLGYRGGYIDPKQRATAKTYAAKLFAWMCDLPHLVRTGTSGKLSIHEPDTWV